MSYKTVVAYSRSEAELKRVLSAIGLLRQKVPDIHVIGLYAIPSPIVYADPNGFIDPGMFELHDKQHKELSERLKHVFEEEMRRQGINYEFRVTRSDTGTAADGVLASCLGAELLIAGQPDPNDPATNDETADTIVFNASCPVLLVPYAPVLPMVSLDRIGSWSRLTESAKPHVPLSMPCHSSNKLAGLKSSGSIHRKRREKMRRLAAANWPRRWHAMGWG